MKIKNLVFFMMIIFGVSVGADTDTDLSKYFINKNIYRPFKKDVKEGPKETYYDNGKLKSKEFYIKNRKAGIWQFFYESGKLKTEIFFAPGSRSDEGMTKTYDEDGVIISEGKIENDNMVGNWIYYDENGKKVYTFDYTDGIIISYDENGKAIMQLSESAVAAELYKIQSDLKKRTIEENGIEPTEEEN